MNTVNPKTISTIAVLAMALLTLATCWAGDSSGARSEAPRVWTEDCSSIHVGFHFYGELLLIDPGGRRTGYDPQSTEPLHEIPGGSYWEDCLATPEGVIAYVTKNLSIPQPASGDYLLTVVSQTGDSTYHLGISCFAECARLPAESSFREIRTDSGSVHTYAIHFDKTSAENCSVTGGFNGNGGQPAFVNRLLSYVNVTKVKTKLPPGTDSTDLFIIYSDDINAESFKAVLNEEDISGMFTPASGGHEVVSLPLEAGKNELTLSVQGTTTDKEATDIDRLEFVVE